MASFSNHTSHGCWTKASIIDTTIIQRSFHASFSTHRVVRPPLRRRWACACCSNASDGCGHHNRVNSSGCGPHPSVRFRDRRPIVPLPFRLNVRIDTSASARPFATVGCSSPLSPRRTVQVDLPRQTLPPRLGGGERSCQPTGRCPVGRTDPTPSHGGMVTKGCVTQDPDRIPKDPPRESTPCRPGGKSGTKKSTVSCAVEDGGSMAEAYPPILDGTRGIFPVRSPYRAVPPLRLEHVHVPLLSSLGRVSPSKPFAAEERDPRVRTCNSCSCRTVFTRPHTRASCSSSNLAHVAARPERRRSSLSDPASVQIPIQVHDSGTQLPHQKSRRRPNQTSREWKPYVPCRPSGTRWRRPCTE